MGLRSYATARTRQPAFGFRRVQLKTGLLPAAWDHTGGANAVPVRRRRQPESERSESGLPTVRMKGEPGTHTSRPCASAARPMAQKEYPTTPDGRYFVVRGRLWRKANPALAPERREALVKQLMDARRSLRSGHSTAEREAARRSVDETKRALGERGPVWWDDGSPDCNRRMARNTPYADWFSNLHSAAQDDS